MVLQTVVALPPFSGNGDARWISNVGDFGGVVVVPIEQLECLLGTVIDSIFSFFVWANFCSFLCVHKFQYLNALMHKNG